MSTILSPLARRAATALLVTLIGAAPALAEARVQPMGVAVDAAACPSLSQPARLYRVGAGQQQGETKPLVTTLVMTCNRNGTRMVC